MAAPLNGDDRSNLAVDVWRRAAGGDAEAQRRLVERAVTLCTFRLRHFRVDEREEIGQCIAASVLRALAAGLVPESNVDGLLEWRGRAEITAFVRARIRERRFHSVESMLECAGHDPAPFDLVATDELRASLHDCIDRIPNRDHRDAVRQRLVAGLSPQEMALQRSTKASVVRVWIARGVAAVRACLERKLRPERGA